MCAGTGGYHGEIAYFEVKDEKNASREDSAVADEGAWGSVADDPRSSCIHSQFMRKESDTFVGRVRADEENQAITICGCRIPEGQRGIRCKREVGGKD